MAFDPQAATAAYIDALGADKLAQAAAYTAGSHWLLLWNLVVSGLAAAVLAVLASPAIVDPAAATPDMAAFAQLESPTASS